MFCYAGTTHKNLDRFLTLGKELICLLPTSTDQLHLLHKFSKYTYQTTILMSYLFCLVLWVILVGTDLKRCCLLSVYWRDYCLSNTLACLHTAFRTWYIHCFGVQLVYYIRYSLIVAFVPPLINWCRCRDLNSGYNLLSCNTLYETCHPRIKKI